MNKLAQYFNHVILREADPEKGNGSGDPLYSSAPSAPAEADAASIADADNDDDDDHNGNKGGGGKLREQQTTKKKEEQK